MMFATIDYTDCCDKPRSEKLAQQWSGLLSSGGMEVQAYVVKDDTILFSTNAGRHAREIKEFVLKQKECVAVEWNQQRTPGAAPRDERSTVLDRSARPRLRIFWLRQRRAAARNRVATERGAPDLRDEMGTEAWS